MSAGFLTHQVSASTTSPDAIDVEEHATDSQDSKRQSDQAQSGLPNAAKYRNVRLAFLTRIEDHTP